MVHPASEGSTFCRTNHAARPLPYSVRVSSKCWSEATAVNRIAVGTHIAMRPRHKAVRAAFPLGEPNLCLADGRSNLGLADARKQGGSFDMHVVASVNCLELSADGHFARDVPRQGLKPNLFQFVYGPTKVVP
jgi:hypothetical protein